MANSLAQKLGLKPNQRVLLLNAPSGSADALGPLPDGVTLAIVSDGSTYDAVLPFVSSRADVEAVVPQTLVALKPGGILWMIYPKKSSKIKTDISRDVGWDSLRAAGLDTVAAVSIDDIWSGLRFRPVGDIHYKK
jgi:hypothetical protein